MTRCVYSCESSRRDLDGDLAAAQDAGANGCEYTCPVFPVESETCNQVDDDCNGIIDDGLVTETDEPVSCATPRILAPDLADGQVRVLSTYALYPDGDEDWFRVRALDRSTMFCSGTDEMEFTATVSGPPGTDFTVDLRLDACAATPVTATGVPDAGMRARLRWGAPCGTDDSANVLVRVRGLHPDGGTPRGSCLPYRLELTHQNDE